ncbi:hypothetical protein RFI_39203, partial [Reticulomyxa filosa]
GYGFVNFATEKERDFAVEIKQDICILGNPVVVRKGHDQTHQQYCLSNTGQNSFKTATQKGIDFHFHADHHDKESSSQDINTSELVDPKNVVYVGNVPDKMDDSSLRLYLEGLLGYPSVTFKRKDHYVFMGFQTSIQAQHCIDQLNGITIGNLKITVQPAKKPEDQETVLRYIKYITIALGQCPLDSQQIYMLEKSYRTVYVSQLPPNTDRDDLANCFCRYGNVLDSRIVKDTKTGFPRYGFVIFDTITASTSAVTQSLRLIHTIHGKDVQ